MSAPKKTPSSSSSSSSKSVPPKKPSSSTPTPAASSKKSGTPSASTSTSASSQKKKPTSSTPTASSSKPGSSTTASSKSKPTQVAKNVPSSSSSKKAVVPPLKKKGTVMKKKVPLKKVIRKDPRIVARPRNFGIGNAIQPKRDLSRFMKWPVYVRIQRQRAILKRRLKVPPAIHQFSRVLTKNAAMRVFKLLHSLRPETQLAKRRRLRAMAELKLKMKKDPSLTKKAPTKLLKPITVKFGLNHVVSLIEMKKAKLVVIAHDVDPIELIVYLPALCRKMNVPYMIVRSKSRLGTVVHQKKVTALVVTEVKPGQQAELVKLQQLARKYFNDQGEELRKSWGGGKLSLKAKQKVAKKLKEAGGASVLELKKKLIE